MNNSFLSSTYEVPEDDFLPRLRVEESRLIRILEAIEQVHTSEAWATLRELLFENLDTTLSKELIEEARKATPDTERLNRLAGQLEWAERYADLAKLAQQYQMQLQSVKKQLNGTSTSS